MQISLLNALLEFGKHGGFHSNVDLEIQNTSTPPPPKIKSVNHNFQEFAEGRVNKIKYQCEISLRNQLLKIEINADLVTKRLFKYPFKKINFEWFGRSMHFG